MNDRLYRFVITGVVLGVIVGLLILATGALFG